MEFVKTSVYVQQYTDSGVTESETDARKAEDIAREERLRVLPEYNRDPGFRSLYEQLKNNGEDDDDTQETACEPTPAPTTGDHLPHTITEDEYEFYEYLQSKKRSRLEAMYLERQTTSEEFAKARKQALAKQKDEQQIKNSTSQSLKFDYNQSLKSPILDPAHLQSISIKKKVLQGTIDKSTPKNSHETENSSSERHSEALVDYQSEDSDL